MARRSVRVVEYTETTVETTGGITVETHRPRSAEILRFPREKAGHKANLDWLMRDVSSTPYATIDDS